LTRKTGRACATDEREEKCQQRVSRRKNAKIKEIVWPTKVWMGDDKMDLKEIGWEGVGWHHVAEDRDHWWAVVNTVMNHEVP
jgi:hypothetical protein